MSHLVLRGTLLDWLLRLEECFGQSNQLPFRHAILRAGILTDEAVSCGTLTKGSDKRNRVEEPSKTGGLIFA
ncbi:hypothetical protein Tco_0483270 [Tanacetum coccineum]